MSLHFFYPVLLATGSWNEKKKEPHAFGMRLSMFWDSWVFTQRTKRLRHLRQQKLPALPGMTREFQTERTCHHLPFSLLFLKRPASFRGNNMLSPLFNR